LQPPSKRLAEQLRSKISIIDFRPDQNTHICNEVIHMTLMTALLQLAVFIVDPVLS